MRAASTNDSEVQSMNNEPDDKGNRSLRYPHGSLGEECEFPERDACDIDDERDQGPLFDAPSEREMGRA